MTKGVNYPIIQFKIYNVGIILTSVIMTTVRAQIPLGLTYGQLELDNRQIAEGHVASLIQIDSATSTTVLGTVP